MFDKENNEKNELKEEILKGEEQEEAVNAEEAEHPEERPETEMNEIEGESSEETVKMMVMPLIPLRGLTVFPEMGLHFDIGREKSIVALERAMMMNQTVFLVSQKDAETDLPTVDDFYHIGTIAKIKQMLKMPGDNIRVLVEGVCRGEIDTLIKETPYFKARVKQIPEQQYPEGVPTDHLALMRMALQLYKQYLRYQTKEDNRYNSASSVKNPGRLADVIATGMDVKIHDKQVIMAEVDPGRRLEKICALLTNEIEILRMQNEISAKVKESVNRNQKEYYLREQMKAIQEELGNDEDIEDELNAWEEKLEKVALPEAVQEKVVKEMKRYRKMPQSSAESGVIRRYIDWILDLPWNVSSQDNIDVIKAKEILEEDHYGLDKVKDRVLEYLSVMKLAGELKGPILCLVGPPGVGKTSIAKSVARSIDRKFVRMS
ncbi:MAG: LON peptidase substrate-binding domain-containing protein, partial [Firmicutes bacterium]|nr:LON peptidase substrate-binding domain-containing protein [Bacillota bacterium]